MTEQTGTLYCAEHPQVPTVLRCSRCERPICPRCLVQTPVGARCRECARLRRLPTFYVGTRLLARGIAAGAGSGLALGAIWGLIGGAGGFGYIGLLIPAGVGYLVGEAVSRAANRRQGRSLQAAAVAGVLLAFVMATFGVRVLQAAEQMGSFAPLIPQLPAAFVALTLKPSLAWLGVVLGAYVAARRIY